jgi:hypothetical protein
MLLYDCATDIATESICSERCLLQLCVVRAGWFELLWKKSAPDPWMIDAGGVVVAGGSVPLQSALCGRDVYMTVVESVRGPGVWKLFGPRVDEDLLPRWKETGGALPSDKRGFAKVVGEGRTSSALEAGLDFRRVDVSWAQRRVRSRVAGGGAVSPRRQLQSLLRLCRAIATVFPKLLVFFLGAPLFFNGCLSRAQARDGHTIR